VNYINFENDIQDKNGDFLFVGRLSKEKGFFDLLEAVKALKEISIYCKIQVIGLAPTEDLEEEINEFIDFMKKYWYDK
jgi:glycosyltransferase involved in cell wall biosynthesis